MSSTKLPSQGCTGKPGGGVDFTREAGGGFDPPTMAPVLGRTPSAPKAQKENVDRRRILTQKSAPAETGESLWGVGYSDPLGGLFDPPPTTHRVMGIPIQPCHEEIGVKHFQINFVSFL